MARVASLINRLPSSAYACIGPCYDLSRSRSSLSISHANDNWSSLLRSRTLAYGSFTRGTAGCARCGTRSACRASPAASSSRRPARGWRDRAAPAGPSRRTGPDTARAVVEPAPYPFKLLRRTPSTIRRLATMKTTSSGMALEDGAGHDGAVRLGGVGAAQQSEGDGQRGTCRACSRRSVRRAAGHGRCGVSTPQMCTCELDDVHSWRHPMSGRHPTC